MIREGYQQTAIGLIPCDWEVKRLGDITDIDIDNLKSNTDRNYCFQYISLEDVEKGTLKSTSECVFYSAPSRARRKVLKNDILVATVRPNLQSHLFIKNDVNDLVCSTGFAVIRCNDNTTNAEFIYHHFFAGIINSQFNTLLVGSNYPAVNSSDIKNLQIPVPTLPEQKAIAEVLGDVDRLINACDKLIAKKRDIKQGAMQELLTGRSRLPGFSGEWEVKELGEITNLLTNGFVGQATKHYTESDDGIIYIQGFNVEENSFNFTGIKRVSSEFSKRNSRSILREDDLLTIQTGDVGLTTIVPKKLEGANCHALIISRFKKEKVYPKFYSQYFNSFVGRNRLKDIETGTTMKHINVKDIAILDFPVPPLPEQKAIAQILSDMDSEIEALEKKRDKYKLVKQGMMQELLTGKTRLL
jgi:type I restriction enzyme S subunit